MTTADTSLVICESDDVGESDDILNRKVIDRLVEILREKEPTLEVAYELQRATAKGDNYLGIVYRICPKDTNFKLILKVPPKNPAQRKQFFARSCFLREALAYEQVLPLLESLQAEYAVPAQERFQHYPQCYGCLATEYDEAIFLEDLCDRGFEIFDRFDSLTPSHVRIVMRAYAKLHASSLALKQLRPANFRQFVHIADIFTERRHDPALNAYFERLKASALESLAGDDDAHYRRRLTAYFARGTFFELLIELLDGANCEPYAVLCHGDCWNNNIMYKYDDDNEIADVCLIDWQLMRYAAPVTDVAYYLFTCTTKAFRDAHYDSMLSYYYVELTKQLKCYDCAVESIFPRAAFEDQLRCKAVVGLLFAMMVLPITTLKPTDAPNLEQLSEIIDGGATADLKSAGFLSANNIDEFNQRIRDVIIDCVERDYI